MTNALALNSFGFAEVSNYDLYGIDGGGTIADVGFAIAGVFSAGVGVVGAGVATGVIASTSVAAAIVASPVVITAAAVCGVVTAAYGVYCAIR